MTLRWLDRPGYDVPFYLLAALAGWATLIAHASFGVPALSLYWVWILFLDGPHLWATLSRTYLDRQEWAARRGVLLGSLLWLVLPAGTLLWGAATGDRAPYLIFLPFAQIWAYWHVVRQHYGFLVLYQRKGGEPAGVDNRVDYAAFYTLMMAPFVSFALRHPEARRALGLPAALGGAEQGLVLALLVATVAAGAIYVGKELLRARRGELNGTKNLFLLACVPLHLVALLHPRWSLAMDLLALAPIVTAFHNIQYQGIVWSYGQRRYGGDAAPARFGPAPGLFRHPIAWYLMGLGGTIALRYATWAYDGRFWPFAPAGRQLGPFSAAEVVNAWWWFVAIHHYYLDQRIWRVKRDPAVVSGLGLASGAA